MGRDLETALLACATGDETGLRDIYDEEAARLLATALRIIGIRDIAEDAVQEAFILIWEHAVSFDPERGSARDWIHAIVRNCARKLRRTWVRRAIADKVSLAMVDFMESASESTTLLTSEECVLRDQLTRLDPSQRASLILAYVAGHTHLEIAALMGVPVGTAKAWVRRGRLALRADLERE